MKILGKSMKPATKLDSSLSDPMVRDVPKGVRDEAERNAKRLKGLQTEAKEKSTGSSAPSVTWAQAQEIFNEAAVAAESIGEILETFTRRRKA